MCCCETAAQRHGTLGVCKPKTKVVQRRLVGFSCCLPSFSTVEWGDAGPVAQNGTFVDMQVLYAVTKLFILSTV